MASRLFGLTGGFPPLQFDSPPNRRNTLVGHPAQTASSGNCSLTYGHRPQASDCILSLSAMVTVSRHPAQTARSGNCSLYLCPPTASLRLHPIPLGNGHCLAAPSTNCKKRKLLSLPMPTDRKPPTASYPCRQWSRTQHILQEAETALFKYTYAHRQRASDCILSLSAMLTSPAAPSSCGRSISRTLQDMALPSILAYAARLMPATAQSISPVASRLQSNATVGNRRVQWYH